mmetsp:Transcript_120/g.310  ORF Transcript_120/g.310 Transcript_120/m.310 type:complete len:342 (+) Transcript_120:2007-3032(+)
MRRLPTASASPSAAPGRMTVRSSGLWSAAATALGSAASPVKTLKLPVVSTHPVPARKPPVTGEGSSRTMLPSLALPSAIMSVPVAVLVSRMAASTVGSLASSSMPSVAYTAAAMRAKMADGPSWISAMAGRELRSAIPHAPTMPLNMMKLVPAASAPSGASGPENTSVAKEMAKTRPPNATVAPTASSRPNAAASGGHTGRLPAPSGPPPLRSEAALAGGTPAPPSCHRCGTDGPVSGLPAAVLGGSPADDAFQAVARCPAALRGVPLLRCGAPRRLAPPAGLHRRGKCAARRADADDDTDADIGVWAGAAVQLAANGAHLCEHMPRVPRSPGSAAKCAGP